MNQELLKSNLNGLERKITMLLNEHSGLKSQISALKLENEHLRDGMKGREEQMVNFKNQIKISKIVDKLNPEDGSSSELKKKVDEYIQEIDHCIAHLSK